MKKCSYCGAEYPDSAIACTLDQTSLLEAPSGSDTADNASHAKEHEPEVDDIVDPESDVPADGEAELCISCLFPNLPDSRWCKRCGSPMSSTAGILMPDAAQAVGFIIRRAVETPANVLILGGVWLLYFPGLVLNLLVLLIIAVTGVGDLRGLAVFISAIAWGVICASMLYRATTNYCKMRSEHSVENAA